MSRFSLCQVREAQPPLGDGYVKEEEDVVPLESIVSALGALRPVLADS